MKTILISLIVIVLLVGAILLYREYYIRRKFQKLILWKYKVVEPLMIRLALKEKVTEAETMALANNPSLRNAVFRMLEAYNRPDLFPADYFTREKSAESFMVNWLEFPTELGKAPDEIELLTKVALNEDEALDYYVFKFKSKPPSWAARYNWMIGVCGPYREGSHPYDVPLRVFSRFNSLGSISPESEVQWVHENIGQNA